MTVVADTSVLCYAVLLECDDILPALFERVHIPPSVHAELVAAETPEAVQRWASSSPSWLQIDPLQGEPHEMLARLHLGEREAITLAEELKADLLLLDEKKARHLAEMRGLRMTGLLGVLVEAADQKLLSLPTAIEKLRHTNFRAPPALLKSLLTRYPPP